MATKQFDLLDGVFVGHDRLWVSTFMIYPDHYMTTVFGPGARAEDTDTTRRSYASEETALAGHYAVLASYGCRKTGLRRWRFFRGLEFAGKGMVNVSRRPISRKSIWIMTAFWALALILAATGVVTYGGGWSIWSNLIIGSLDAYMLYQCIMGLLWVYGIPGKGRRRGV